MALSFPANPTNGQVYTDTVTGNRYLFNSTANVWSYAANNVGMSVSSTPPSNVAAGAMWYNRDIGRTFVYYDDGDSKQWVETVPATGTFDTSTVASYANAAAVLKVAPAYDTANAGYVVANAGYVVANAGYVVANAGYVVSNAAFDKANNALANTSDVSFNGNLIFPNGNIGIGITPSFKLDMYDATNSYIRMRGDTNVVQQLYRYSTDASSAQINLFKLRGTLSAASNVATNDITGRLIFYGYDGLGNYQTAEVRSAVDGAVSTTIMPGRLSFYTNSGSGSGSATERMRIDANGNLGLGTTSPSATLHINSTINQTGLKVYSSGYATGTSAVVIQKATNDASTAQILMQFLYNSGTTGLGQINGNGGSQAAFGSYSDSRLKENIENLPSQLDKICSLRPVEFDYIEGTGYSGHQIGFIAQEMQEVYPDVVAEGSDGMLTVTGWNKTEARLVKAIQELKAELDAAKAEIEKLKGN